MIGGGTWEAVGLLDKLPVQVAAAGGRCRCRIPQYCGYDFASDSIEKTFFGGILWPSPFVF
jgi:hypothetical protein